MARSQGREHVWLQCTETDDQNHRESINTRGGLPEAMREGLRKYCPRLRRHTIHKIKRK
ncbi:50S ribosomal protein L33 [Paludisphaera rhizosphaerae]|uniref:50S ribosomal protein L33 n=1 Tax=Paludisphaera rhizosphaerae TaxID=2711216 RepID=UPI0013EB40A3|nr:50S ribosomal protein L33 [Paludisphaera rhizosphaerae]